MALLKNCKLIYNFIIVNNFLKEAKQYLLPLFVGSLMSLTYCLVLVIIFAIFTSFNMGATSGIISFLLFIISGITISYFYYKKFLNIYSNIKKIPGSLDSATRLLTVSLCSTILFVYMILIFFKI